MIVFLFCYNNYFAPVWQKKKTDPFSLCGKVEIGGWC